MLPTDIFLLSFTNTFGRHLSDDNRFRCSCSRLSLKTCGGNLVEDWMLLIICLCCCGCRCCFQRIRQGRTFLGLGGGQRTALMASSKTVLRPFCVKAEHSRYLTAPTSFAIDKPCKRTKVRVFVLVVSKRFGWRKLENYPATEDDPSLMNLGGWGGVIN